MSKPGPATAPAGAAAEIEAVSLFLADARAELKSAGNVNLDCEEARYTRKAVAALAQAVEALAVRARGLEARE